DGLVFFFSSRRRHTRWPRDWSSDVCSSDLGKTFIGTLTGVDTETLSVCLTNAKSDAGDIHKVFLNGDTIVQISSFEKPFDLQSLGERLERVFPRMVRVMDDAGVIVVMDRIRVNERG